MKFIKLTQAADGSDWIVNARYIVDIWGANITHAMVAVEYVPMSLPHGIEVKQSPVEILAMIEEGELPPRDPVKAIVPVEMLRRARDQLVVDRSQYRRIGERGKITELVLEINEFLPPAETTLKAEASNA